MIDFTKNPFKKYDEKAMKKFKSKKYITKEKFDATIDLNDEDVGANVMDIDSITGGDSFDLSGYDGGVNGGEDVFGMDEDYSYSDIGSSNSERNISDDLSWQKDNIFLSWVSAPFYLGSFIVMSMYYNSVNRENQISILKALNGITMFSAIISLLLWLVDFKFIFNLGFQSITSIFMFTCSLLVLKFVYKEEYSLPFVKDKESEEKDATLDGFDDLDSLGNFDDLEMSDDAMNFGGVLSLDSIDDFDNVTFDDSDDYDEEEVHSSTKTLSPSPIDISSLSTFKETISDVYRKNKKYQGVEITNRLDLLESLSGYIITNDKDFGSWKIIKPESTEGVSIAYAIYKALIKINKSFATNEDKMIVYSMKKNPLLFKIDLELPDYFTVNLLKSKINEFEDVIKKDEADDRVSIQISAVQGLFTFKLLNLENRNLISMGDILRFEDTDKDPSESALSQFGNPKIGMPMLVGLQGNEHPLVIDFEDNTSGTIVGGSGSGKSWLTFSLMFNFILANDYNNTQFVILDKKNAPFWNQFAKFPHVLGYHTDPSTYLDLVREIYEEINRRKALLNELGAENIKGLRKMYTENGETEKLKEVPLFTVIIDEITSTMSRLKTDYESADDIASYNELKTILGNITEEGRSLGVRLLVIGQRSIDASVPKSVMLNSSLKFGMRMENDTEFETMFGKSVAKLKKPDDMGMGLLRSFSTKGIPMIKTLTVGGADDSQILTLIRVLALEWVRRSIGKDDIINPPKGLNIPLCYNRNKYANESLREVREGYILSAKTQDKNLALNPEDIVDGQVFDSSKQNKNIFLDKKSDNLDDYSVDDLTYSDDDFLDIDDDNYFDSKFSSLDDDDFEDADFEDYDDELESNSSLSIDLSKNNDSELITDFNFLDDSPLFGGTEEANNESKDDDFEFNLDGIFDTIDNDESTVEDLKEEFTSKEEDLDLFSDNSLDDNSLEETTEVEEKEQENIYDFASAFSNIFDNNEEISEKKSIFDVEESKEIIEVPEEIEEIVIPEDLSFSDMISKELEDSIDVDDEYLSTEDNVYVASTHLNDKLEQEIYSKTNGEIFELDLDTLNSFLTDSFEEEISKQEQEQENNDIFGDIDFSSIFIEDDVDETEEVLITVENMNLLQSDNTQHESENVTKIATAFKNSSENSLDEIELNFEDLIKQMANNTHNTTKKVELLNPEIQEKANSQKEAMAESKKFETIRKEKLRKQAQNKKPEPKTPRTTTGAVQFGYKNTAQINSANEPNIGVKEYIIQNGSKHHGLRNYKIQISELESVYSSAKIQKALDSMLIIRDGDFYTTSL